MWALDPSVPMPSLKEIEKISVEDSGLKTSKGSDDEKSFPFLIKVEPIKEIVPLLIIPPVNPFTEK